MKRTQDRPFDPTETDRREIAGFGASLVVAEPGEPLTLRGWSWESHNGTTIFGEAGYLTDAEQEVRVRTWKHLPGFSEADAAQAHLADLRDNFAAGEPTPADSVGVIVDGEEHLAARFSTGGFDLAICRLDGVTLTIAWPADSLLPKLVDSAGGSPGVMR